MASYVWVGGSSSNWSDAANWSPNGVPGASDSATVSAGGTYQITVDVSAIGSVTLSASGASLAVDNGPVSVAGTIDLQAGSLLLEQTLQGGTITEDGGTIVYGGGTLDGVTLDGPLDLSADNSYVTITDGITFTGAAPEEITVTGNGASLQFSGSETVDQVAITLGSSAPYAYLYAGNGLTLGPDSRVDVVGDAYVNGLIDNQGSISVTAGTLYDYGATTNEGLISVSNGGANYAVGGLTNSGTVSVSGSGTSLEIDNLDNSGSISVAGGDTITLEGTLSNSGTITLQAGSTLDLQSSETLSDLGTINNEGGTVSFAGGTLDLTGETLDVTKGSLFDGTPLPSKILNGTIIVDGGTLVYDNTTLDGVTLDGPLDLSADNSYVTITDGITFTGAAPEEITVTGNGASLQFSGSETVDQVAITLGSSAPYAYLYAGNGLTLGPDSRVDVVGDAYVNGLIDNQGSISVTAGTLYDYGATTNESSISVSNGGANYAVDGLTNSGTVSVSGSGTSLQIDNLDNSGSISVAGGDTITLEGTLSNSGTITLQAGSTLDLQSSETLSDLGTINNEGGTVSFAGGTLDLTGETLDVTKGSLFDGTPLPSKILNGTIIVDGGTLVYDNTTLDGVTLDGPLDLSADNSYVTITDGITFTGAAPEEITVTGNGASLQFSGSETVDQVAITLGSSAPYAYLYAGNGLTLGPDSRVDVVGDAYVNGLIDNQGSISVTAGTLYDYGATTNESSISVSNGGANYAVDGLTNSGTVSVSGSGTSLQINNNLDNSGNISVAGGATLKIDQPTSSLGTVEFLDRSGTLQLDGANGGYTGTLNFFQFGDTLTLTGTGYSLIHMGNTLTLYEGGSVVDSFTLTGRDYTTALFLITDNDGNTVITTDAPCFCEGTRILTDQGERPVENLQVGDVVITRQHGIETRLPIRWIGHRKVMIASHPEPEHVDPICIARHAIAPDLPHRDLFVSPDHAIHLYGVLIQARQLLNHGSIRRDRGRSRVTYYHVELERHALLLAEGLECESYLESGNRAQFDNGGAAIALHSRFAGNMQGGRDGGCCAPFVTSSEQVKPIWQRLAGRAEERGLTRGAYAVSHDAQLCLRAEDGRLFRPFRVAGNRWHFRLPPGISTLRLCSQHDMPSTLEPWSDDRRRLGVAVSRISCMQPDRWLTLSLAGLSSTDGWWPTETLGGLSWRWTNGEALLTLPADCWMIEIAVHAVMPALVRTDVAKVG